MLVYVTLIKKKHIFRHFKTYSTDRALMKFVIVLAILFYSNICVNTYHIIFFVICMTTQVVKFGVQ